MDITEIQSVLKHMRERVPPSSNLVLVGGSALTLLGSPRLTIDIDFVADDVRPNELHQFIMQIAKELEIHVEPVPIDRFIPPHLRGDHCAAQMGRAPQNDHL